mmetsp:Transcript_128692/g.250782  ORF Transcript_128692/g.250782 Transcript_128692/m.250782 type:complete len:172 (+) Transcript_128692:42-557(+)
MDVKLGPGQQLKDSQRAHLTKAFDFVAFQQPGARQRKREALPGLVPKAELPRLLRGCGKAPTSEEMATLMASVEADVLDVSEFIRLFEEASQSRTMNEVELFKVLKELDLTGTETLAPEQFKEMLMSCGEGTPAQEVDRILQDLPRNRLGRVSCRLIARKLAGGPDGIPHI